MEMGKSLRKPQFNCLLFDLDDTLYPPSTGIAKVCRKNIDEFLVQKFGFSRDVVSSLRTEFYQTYGSTLAGLRALGYEVDADEYHRFVHGSLPYEVLKPDPLLRSLLLSMPQRKLIFTNSDRIHAHKVLQMLGVEDCFADVISFDDLNPCKSADVLIKPSVEAMKCAIRIANEDPQRTLFLDDNRRNIASAKAAGLNTVLVGSSVRIDGADYALENIHHVKQANIPEIWDEAEDDYDGEERCCTLPEIWDEAEDDYYENEEGCCASNRPNSIGSATPVAALQIVVSNNHMN